MALGVSSRTSGFPRPSSTKPSGKYGRQARAAGVRCRCRCFHCSMEAGGTIPVFDVWESMEQFRKSGETLLPVISKGGADAGEPQVPTIHNMQNGHSQHAEPLAAISAPRCERCVQGSAPVNADQR